MTICYYHRKEFNSHIYYTINRVDRRGPGETKEIGAICQECFEDMQGCIETVRAIEKMENDEK